MSYCIVSKMPPSKFDYFLREPKVIFLYVSYLSWFICDCSCSLVCFKKHKEIPCAKPVCPDDEKLSKIIPESREDRAILVDEPSEVLLRVELESIASSSEIRDALKNEDLQKLICNIDASANSMDELNKAMGSGVFRIFADKVFSAAKISENKQ
ncbi:hypothetical protein Dimus_032596 [Dionaea muscipula]